MTTIDYQTSTTKGLLLNSLMSNDICLKRTYHNNLSSYIRHKSTINQESTIVKISNVKILPQKANCKTGDNIPATIIQMKTKTYNFIIDIKFGIFNMKLLILFVLSVVQIWAFILYYHNFRSKKKFRRKVEVDCHPIIVHNIA